MFRNRVLLKHEQSVHGWDRATRKGLRRDPSFSEFIEKFDDYAALIREVRDHAAPQVEYLGEDIGFFDQIFTEESIPEFELLVQDLSGRELRLPWEQKSGSRASIALDSRNLTWINDQYSEDYRVFGDWFPPASHWENMRKWWSGRGNRAV